jgi:cell shape-determining protein MreC
MLSSERFKGIQNNFTFSPSHTENQSSSNQIAVMGYMNEKIKYLEIENNELKKEISMKSSDKEKMDYYLRLRRDLLEELERNKNER